jgi:hypothetical protein
MNNLTFLLVKMPLDDTRQSIPCSSYSRKSPLGNRMRTLERRRKLWESGQIPPFQPLPFRCGQGLPGDLGTLCQNDQKLSQTTLSAARSAPGTSLFTGARAAKSGGSMSTSA